MVSEIEAVRADLAHAYRRLCCPEHGRAGGSHPEIARRQRAEQAVWVTLRDLALAVDAEPHGRTGHAEPYCTTTGHAERVARLARRLAALLGLPGHEVLVVERAALLHDIGKSAVRSGGAGGDDMHAVVGALLVAPFGFLAPAAPMIRHHHERWDGAGHPDGLRGLAIPLGARIIAVANAFDAHTGAGGAVAAVDRLAGQAGRSLDPEVLDLLRTVVDTPESPP